MRERKKRGRPGRTADGMRAVLLDDLRDERAEMPRATNRPMTEFFDEPLTKRPVYGLHKLARLSEHFLHKAKFGKIAYRRYLKDCDAYYFEVRQVIRNLVHHHKASDRLTKGEADALRNRITGLVDDGRAVLALFESVRRCKCPCCRGTGRIFDVTDGTDTAVKAVLDDAVKAGRLGYSSISGYYGI